MKRTKDKSRGNTRNGQEKSATPTLVEFPARKSGSVNSKAQATGPSESGSATLRTKTSATGNASGSKKKSDVPKALANVKRAADALRRLHVKQDDLDAAPRITPLLKNADGGMKRVYNAMRFAGDEVIRAFLAKYDSIPEGDRERLPMEAVALAAGLDINSLLGSVMLALQAQAVNTVKIIAMTHHPEITRARVRYGLMPSGEKDRTALDTAMGFLPSPKGPTFIGKAIFGSGRNVMDQQGGDDEEEPMVNNDNVDLDRLFPPATLMQEKLIPVRQKMLPEG
jgi:hypothetical protein